MAIHNPLVLANLRHRLGQTLHSLGEAPAATSRNARLGPDHPVTLTNIRNLAAGYQAIGRPAEAVPLYEEAASGVERRKFRYEHANRIVPGTIAVYTAAGQHEWADAWRRK